MDFERLKEIQSRRNPYEIFDTKINKFFPAKNNDDKGRKKKKKNINKKENNKPQTTLGQLEEYLCFYIDRSDVVALWLDNDSQGENICVQIRELLNSYKFYDGNKAYPVRYRPENLIRAKFSSLANRDIIKAFRTMNNKIDDCKANARYAQEEIDLRLGISFSVYLTDKLKSFIKNYAKYKVCTSYGPCQFPTFWFCYDRMKKILEEKPKI